MEETIRRLKVFLFEISNGLDVVIDEECKSNNSDISKTAAPLLRSFNAIITETISILLTPSQSPQSSSAKETGKAFIERMQASLSPAVVPSAHSHEGDAPKGKDRSRIIKEKDRVIDFASTEVAVLRGKLEADIELKRKASIRKKVMSMNEKCMLETLRALTDEVNALTESIIARERETLSERLALDRKLYTVRLLEERLGPECYDNMRHFPVFPCLQAATEPKMRRMSYGSSGSYNLSKALSYEEIPFQHAEQGPPSTSSSSVGSPAKANQQQIPSPPSPIGSPQKLQQYFHKAGSSVGSPQKSRRYSVPKELPSSSPSPSLNVGKTGSYAQKVFYKHWCSNVPEGSDQAVFTQQSLDKVFVSLGYSLPPEQVGSALVEMSPSTPGVISWPVFNQYMTLFVNNNKQNITKKYVI